MRVSIQVSFDHCYSDLKMIFDLAGMQEEVNWSYIILPSCEVLTIMQNAVDSIVAHRIK